MLYFLCYLENIFNYTYKSININLFEISETLKKMYTLCDPFEVI